MLWPGRPGFSLHDDVILWEVSDVRTKWNLARMRTQRGVARDAWRWFQDVLVGA
jgi:hypothetical protein